MPLCVAAHFADEHLSKLRYKLGKIQRRLAKESALKLQLKAGEKLFIVDFYVKSHVIDELREWAHCLRGRRRTSTQQNAAPMMLRTENTPPHPKTTASREAPSCGSAPGHGDGRARQHSRDKDRQRHRSDHQPFHKAPHENREGASTPRPQSAVRAKEAPSASDAEVTSLRIPTQKPMHVDSPQPATVRTGARFRRKAHLLELGVATNKTLLPKTTHVTSVDLTVGRRGNFSAKRPRRKQLDHNLNSERIGPNLRQERGF